MSWQMLFADLVYRHFSAITGYSFWLVLIAMLASSQGNRFDNEVRYLVTAWVSSVGTYMTVGEKLIQPDQKPTTP